MFKDSCARPHPPKHSQCGCTLIPVRHIRERGVGGRGDSSRTLVVGALNVHGCSTSVSKRCEKGDVGAVAFGGVTGRVSGVGKEGQGREWP